MVPYSTLNLREFRDILNFTTRYLIPLNFNGIDLVRRLISTLNAQPRKPDAIEHGNDALRFRYADLI